MASIHSYEGVRLEARFDSVHWDSHREAGTFRRPIDRREVATQCFDAEMHSFEGRVDHVLSRDGRRGIEKLRFVGESSFFGPRDLFHPDVFIDGDPIARELRMCWHSTLGCQGMPSL